MTLRSDLANLTDRVRRLTASAPAALDHLRDEVDMHDSMPTHVIGASAPTAGPPVIYEGTCRELLEAGFDIGGIYEIRCNVPRPCPDHDGPVTETAVERAAARISAPLRNHKQLTDTLTAVIRAVTHAEIEINRATPRIDTTGKRCTQGKSTKDLKPRDGYLSWTDPLCTRPADRDCDGLCRPCFDLEARWRTAHNLPAFDRVPMCVRDCGRPATDGRNDHLCAACRMADSRAKGRAS